MKKLFSYLLISSMVVLSSCTNYDDQFDDLNSQINSLKGQIEGFSSLSSGLTALQGTVASLQSAVANIPVTPATDISGLESTQAALQAGLTSLADAVAALKTQLEGAATAAEVAALQTALTNVQSDLSDLLASNNIYTPQGGTLTVGTQAQLTFATALGDKVSIINGGVDVTQTASMDATELAALMAKITSVTTEAKFTATATGITPVAGFTSLVGAGNVTLDVSGPISLPVLETAAVVTVADNSKTTSFSAPKLTTVSSFASNALTLSKATSIDLSSLIRYDGALTITQKSGLVNLDALGNTPASGSVETTNSLTLVGATSLALSARTAGTITANDVTAAISLPVWKGTTASSFDKASEVVLPKITGGVAINLANMAPKATKFHYIGAGLAASSTVTNYPTFTTGAANTNLETLIIDGISTSVNISDATDLTSLTFTGAANTVTLNDLDSMTDITLGYVSKIGSYSSGSLTVTDNDELETLTADSLDDISGLTITGNTNLNKLSFAALNSIGTSATGTAITATELAINNNDLTASNIQIASETTAVTAVAGAITTDSGLKAMQTYLNAAAAKDTSVHVEFDNVTAITLANGDKPSSYSGASDTQGEGIEWTGEDDDVDLILKVASGVTTAAVAARYQVATAQLSSAVFASTSTGATVNGQTLTLSPDGTQLASVTFDSNGISGKPAISGFVATNPSTYATALKDELNAQLDAASAPFDVNIVNDYSTSHNYTFNAIQSGSTGATLTSLPFKFKVGSTNLTGTDGLNATTIATSIAAAITGTGSPLSKTWTASVASGVLTLKKLLATAATEDFFSTTARPDITFSGYSAALSLTHALLSSSDAIGVATASSSKGWRITVKNESLTVKAANLEASTSFMGGTLDGGDNIATSVLGGALSNTAVANVWANIRAGVSASAATVVSFTAWL